jgi:hypothetical protein
MHRGAALDGGEPFAEGDGLGDCLVNQLDEIALDYDPLGHWDSSVIQDKKTRLPWSVSR